MKPAAQAPIFTMPELPDDLTERDQWVLWRLETRNGKPTKVPYHLSYASLLLAV